MFVYMYVCIYADMHESEWVNGWLSQIEFYTLNMGKNVDYVQTAVLQVIQTCFCHRATNHRWSQREQHMRFVLLYSAK